MKITPDYPRDHMPTWPDGTPRSTGNAFTGAEKPPARKEYDVRAYIERVKADPSPRLFHVYAKAVPK